MLSDALNLIQASGANGVHQFYLSLDFSSLEVSSSCFLLFVFRWATSRLGRETLGSSKFYQCLSYHSPHSGEKLVPFVGCQDG